MMSEFRVTVSPALAKRQPVVRDGVSLKTGPEGTILHLLAHTSESDPSGFAQAIAAGGLTLRSVLPGQWFAVGDAVLSHVELNDLTTALKPKAEVVDQSHGRVRICVSGSMAARVLAKGTAVDLVLATFPVGYSTTTLIGHIAAHLTRTNQDSFELIVLRGFAESLWDELARMSLEFS